MLRATEPELAAQAHDSESQEVVLFEPPLKVRRDVVLNDEQRKAAKNTGRPTLIKGPAGSGKSVVITERIKNLVNEHRGALTQERLRILVTTFNQGMTNQLKDWLEDILEVAAELKPHANIRNPHYEFHAPSFDIYVMHFDVLPRRLCHIFNTIPCVSGDIKKTDCHYRDIREIVEDLENQGIKPPVGTNAAEDRNPRFLLEEYHRVIFAQEITTREQYLQAERHGRGTPRQQTSREFMWKVISRYANRIHLENAHSFITFRSKFLKRLSEFGSACKVFSYVFIDEFQDCTPADYRTFYALLKDPNRIIIAGDFAQAVDLGTSAGSPHRGRMGEQELRKFKIPKLTGSYRLPYWICRAVSRFSEEVVAKHGRHGNHADLLAAYKGAPPGARPIVVAASSAVGMARKIKLIKNAYRSFDPDPCTIMEKDCELYWALNAQGCPTPESTTILRLKGLEKTCVVWSTRGEVTQVSDVEEFVYTILTRTSCLLIIALYPDLQKEFRPILKELNQPDLNFWDKESEDFWSEEILSD